MRGMRFAPMLRRQESADRVSAHHAVPIAAPATACAFYAVTIETPLFTARI
jgi:hypothetical protein